MAKLSDVKYVIVGLDASITGSGLTKYWLDKDMNVLGTDYLGFCKVKKHCDEKNIFRIVSKDFKTYIEKNQWVRAKIKEFVLGANYVGIEDYAYKGTGQAFHIGEFTGAIKEMLYEMEIPIRIYDIGTIKIFGCGKGNGDKISMYDSFVASKLKHKINISHLPPVVTSSGAGNPAADLVDSFFICEMLTTELKLRKALIQLKDLPEKIIECFNRVTKANPQNILSTDFIQKDVTNG